MAKKQVAVSLRKPSSPPSSDAHVEVAAVSETRAIEPRGAAKDPVWKEAFVSGSRAQAGKDGFRELTLYVTPELAHRLTLHCLEHDRDVSAFVASLLTQKLDEALPPGPSQVSEPSIAEDVGTIVRWMREQVQSAIGSTFARVTSFRFARQF